MRYGVVISFNSAKGIGNIKDNSTNIEYGFTKADCPHEVEILDEVAFEVTTENHKMRAINVKPS
ncbi:MAG: cold-shock protein [Pedobacter sp.]|nr:MAG: cold-shock protein [Pedobacter sp.]